MKNYKYKIDHDYGLAPNPFGGFCTLAVCKSDIRKSSNLEIGSWIFGIGAKSVGEQYFQKLIFCMKVEEKLTFNEYWNDSRFQYKKPIINGSLVQMYGDNFYHQDENNNWIQENSAHSLVNGIPNETHLKRDTSGEFVLISKENFYYWGDKAIIVPDEYKSAICTDTRNRAFAEPKEIVDEFIMWLEDRHEKGVLLGDPISWSVHLNK
ncbi:hypothetical protein ETU08_11685 [Apibacter muscae]|uniref:Nmad2 family putative nucleotide modification protein n=1 Tax=Apibacter muscae TaxID=2509004 RepID=UPI0011AD416E|nr:hypothetical protein [Apibacter muscae]TWP27657.1 hypothetical protein ETU08_11685 [Apibacter muscae]